ncbi:MAG: hypothetical protein WBD02_08620 [Acidimicrobiia bacterium]
MNIDYIDVNHAIEDIDDIGGEREERDLHAQSGMATAELLGNAALGIAALVLIWAGLQALGLDIVDWIRTQVIH